MNNLNTVLIEGQLTRDPFLTASAAQTVMCKMSLANNRYYLNKDGKWKQDPSYFSVYVFGSVAETCLRVLKKGRGIRVVGRLKQYSWPEAGITREKVAILAEHIEFQPEKKQEEKTPEAAKADESVATMEPEVKDAPDAPLPPADDVPTTEIASAEGTTPPSGGGSDPEVDDDPFGGDDFETELDSQDPLAS